MKAAEEDKDSAEIRRKTQDDETDDEQEKGRITQGARPHDVSSVHGLDVLVRKLTREEERSG